MEEALAKIQQQKQIQLNQLTQEHDDMVCQLRNTKRKLNDAKEALTQLASDSDDSSAEVFAARQAKPSFISTIQTKTLKNRTMRSDNILKKAFEDVTTLHGNDTLPFVLASYFETHLTDAFLLLLVQHYRQGWLYQHWQHKLSNKLQQAIGPVVATELIDSVNGVNFTGFLAVMETLRNVLPTGSLPTKHDIKWIRDMWGKELAHTLDLQPTGLGTVGWDVDPFKLLRFLLTKIYPKLLSDVCAVKKVRIVRIESKCRAHFVDTDPHLKIGDHLIIRSNIHRIHWVVRPQSIGARHVYLFDPPVAASTPEYLADCQYQRAICLLRSDDGRTVLNDGQVLESWRFANEQLAEHAQNVDDVWFSCLIDGAEDKDNMQKGRVRQFEGLKKLREDGYVEVEGTQYPIVILGPADLKNQKTMYQRGGNPSTTNDFCTHCGRTRSLRSLTSILIDKTGTWKMTGPCYRVGSGARPESISELDISVI